MAPSPSARSIGAESERTLFRAWWTGRTGHGPVLLLRVLRFYIGEPIFVLGKGKGYHGKTSSMRARRRRVRAFDSVSTTRSTTVRLLRKLRMVSRLYPRSRHSSRRMRSALRRVRNMVVAFIFGEGKGPREQESKGAWGHGGSPFPPFPQAPVPGSFTLRRE